MFLKYAVSQRPILLLTDGHKSHVNIDVIDLCRSNDVILFRLPLHTTHALQPLDVAVFKSLKDAFSKRVRALSFTKKNFIVTKRGFSRVVKRPLEQAFSIPNVKAGFAKSGIYAFNPDAVAKHKLITFSLHESFSSTSDSESSSFYPSSVSESPNPPSQPFLLSQSPSQLSQQTTQTIVPPSLPPPHTVYGTSGALHAEDAVTVASSGTESVCSQSDTVTTSTTQTPVLSPSSVVYAPQVSMRSPIMNPLVMVGLVLEDLSDILSTPPNDSVVTKKRTKRITGARNLTSEEYVEMRREDKRKKIEAEELKEKRKHEREKRKREIEEKKKETQLKKWKREEEKEQQKNGRRKAQANTRRQVRESSSVSDNIPDWHFTSSSSTASDSDTMTGEEPGCNRPQRRSQLPAQF